MSEERDRLVSQRYRELGAEEPSPKLDRAIVGAARRATNRRRWYPSLAAAAVLVFAVAIAFHIEREPPPSEPAVAAAPEPEQRAAEAPPQSRAERKVSPPPRAAPAPRFTPEPPPVAPPPGAPPPSPPSANANMQAPSAAAADVARSRADDERYAAEARPAPSGAAMAARITIDQTPQEWLERIARLRTQGRDDQAETELKRFRERYPDYRIPDEMAKRLAKQAPAPAEK